MKRSLMTSYRLNESQEQVRQNFQFVSQELPRSLAMLGTDNRLD